MRNSESDINDTQASYYLNKLYEFIGSQNIERALQKHKRALDLSGPVVKTTLRSSHPWWNTLEKIQDIKRKGMSIKRHLTPEIKMLVADGLKITKLKPFMPDSVQRKYKRDLITKYRAFDYLFEIQIAWHFYLQGHKLQWYEDDGEKHPEFLVRTPSFDFNIECKRISVDIGRKIHRGDSRQFFERLFKKIKAKGYSGSLAVTVNDRLEGNQIEDLVNEVTEFLDSKKAFGVFPTSLAEFKLDLHKSNGWVIGVSEMEEQLRKTQELEGAHAAFFAPQKRGGDLVNPFFVSIKCKKADEVLNGIYDKLYETASEQLIDSVPSIIVAFLEDVHDLRELRSGTGLQIMTNELLNKDKFSHIIGISYSSETQIFKSNTSETYNSQNLFFQKSEL